MQPLAQALDILQSETKCFGGVLLPALVALKKKLNEAKASMMIAAPLADSLLKGIDKRFQGYFQCKDLILVSMTMPQFPTRWVESGESQLSKCVAAGAAEVWRDV